MTARACCLPELVGEILSYLSQKHNEPTLFACALVCKVWADEATTILWAHHSERALEHLLSVVCSDFSVATMEERIRVSFYTNKITQLKVNTQSPTCTRLKQIEAKFARLSSLELRQITVKVDVEDIAYFFQPSLRDLRIYGESIKVLSKTLCTIVLSVGSHLTSLYLERCKIEPNDVLALIQTCHALEVLDIHQVSFGSATPMFLQHLATLPKLQHLEIYLTQRLTQTSLQHLAKIPEPMFPALCSLSCLVDIDAFINAFRHQQYLTFDKHLNLDLIGTMSDDLFPTIVACFPNVGHLRVDIFRARAGTAGELVARVQPSDLLAISNGVPFLRRLDLQQYRNMAVENVLKDEDVELLAKSHPLLEYVYIDSLSLTQQSFFTLGKHCKLLEECLIYCQLFVADLGEHKDCLFPELTHFYVLEVEPSLNHPTREKDFAGDLAVLKKHMPKLKVWPAESMNNEFSQDVARNVPWSSADAVYFNLP